MAEECFKCDYDNCRAKEEIGKINGKLHENDKEFKHFNNMLHNIANHQTKISADLTTHMITSSHKNDELLKSINTLSTHLKEHSTSIVDKIEQLISDNQTQEKKLGIHGLKLHILWAGSITILTASVALFWDLIKQKLGV